MFDANEIKLLDEYIDHFLSVQVLKYKGNKTMSDKLSHIFRCNRLIDITFGANDMARLGCKFHDIGRFSQYENLGKFDDKTMSHNLFGEFFLQQEIKRGHLKSSYELDTIRLISMYHGLEDIIPKKTQLSDEVLDCVKKVSIIDEIDNGCIAALGYLEHEIETDAKNFAANNPDLDMKSVSPEVLGFFIKGEKFDKNKYCRTYADYILFACLLAIKSLRGKYYLIAKTSMQQKCYIYENALAGYRDLFNRFVDPALSQVCYEILLGYYTYSDNYKFSSEKLISDSLTIDIFGTENPSR